MGGGRTWPCSGPLCPSSLGVAGAERGWGQAALSPHPQPLGCHIPVVACPCVPMVPCPSPLSQDTNPVSPGPCKAMSCGPHNPTSPCPQDPVPHVPVVPYHSVPMSLLMSPTSGTPQAAFGEPDGTCPPASLTLHTRVPNSHVPTPRDITHVCMGTRVCTAPCLSFPPATSHGPRGSTGHAAGPRVPEDTPILGIVGWRGPCSAPPELPLPVPWAPASPLMRSALVWGFS